MLVAVICVKGSPGASVTTLALAATWPQGWRCVMVECDPAGGDLQACFGLHAQPGLGTLAAAGRREHRPGLVWQHTQELPGGLATVPAPTRADHAARTVEMLTNSPRLHALAAASEQDEDRRPPEAMLLDAGRVTSADALSPGLTSGLSALLSAADAVLVTVRNELRSLSHAVVTLETITAWTPSDRVRVLLIDGGGHSRVKVPRGYSCEEVASALGFRVAGRLPWDQRAAAALAGRDLIHPRPLARSTLMQAAATIAADLAAEHATTAAPERPGEQAIHSGTAPAIG